MQILVTGGAGYLGTELIYLLANNKAISKIIVYDNLSRKNYNLFIGRRKLDKNKIRFVKGEILDTRKLKKELNNIDIVYHLAAKVTTPFADQNPHEFEQINNWGTAELIYNMEEIGVKHFVYMSSASIYGASEKSVDINTLPNPRTFYGISKLKGEEHAERLINSPIKTHIIRCGNVFGYSKSMRFDSVINKFMMEANFSNRITIEGNGEQTRSFIHINRASEFLASLVTNSLPAGTYNLVENSYSVNEIAQTLKEIYPNMEMLYVNQNTKLRRLSVKPDQRIKLKNTKDLKIDLLEFSKEFTF